jgi:hypothetical protein
MPLPTCRHSSCSGSLDLLQEAAAASSSCGLCSRFVLGIGNAVAKVHSLRLLHAQPNNVLVDKASASGSTSAENNW